MLLLPFLMAVCPLFSKEDSFNIDSLSKKTASVVIRGRVNAQGRKPIKVRLVYCPANAVDYYPIDSLAFKATTNSEGDFTFLLPAADRIMKIVGLYIEDPKFFQLTDYVVQRGDQIAMFINLNGDIDTVTFNGEGGEKYRCRRQIELLMEQFDNERTWESNIPILKTDSIQKCFERYITYRKVIGTIIENYRGRIKPDVLTIMEIDAVSKLKSYQELFLKELRLKNKNVDLEYVQRLFKMDPPLWGYKPEVLVNQSTQVFQLLVSSMAVRLLMEKGADITFSDLFSYIRSTYDGVFRDKLFYAIFSNPQVPVLYDKIASQRLPARVRKDFVTEALKGMEDGEITRKMHNIANQTKIDSPAYNFVLPDSNGKIVTLESLRGKLVIMDLWFTGCSGCAGFAEMIQTHIKPEFKGQSNIVYVSIGTDASIEMWKKSMATNKYTDSDNINLYTSGMGFNHEITRKYGLIGLPFALLIDQQGNVVEDITFQKPNLIISAIKEKLSN